MQSPAYANCWRTNDAAAVGRFLIAFSEVHRPFTVSETTEQVCFCNNPVFSVALACESTRLTCTACNSPFDILPPSLNWQDSVDVADGTDDYQCDDCQNTAFNITLGKAHVPLDGAATSPAWQNIGARCCECDLLSCVNDFCWPSMPEYSFDPTCISELAKQLRPDCSWLVDSLDRCVTGTWTNACYIRFVDSANANQPGAEWQYLESIVLAHPRMGSLNVDVLSDRRVGGIEFYDRLFVRHLER